MKRYKSILVFALSVLLSNSAFALKMNTRVIEQFKKSITQCSQDAISLKGEFKNSGYYVNLKDGIIKGHSFSNVIVKFEGLTQSSRNDLLNNFTFSNLQEKCSIKLAGDITPSEVQGIINQEVGRNIGNRKIFNNAVFTFEEDAVTVNGNINLKRVPGNPFAYVSSDEFSPFTAKLGVDIVGTTIYLKIINGQINGQEINEDLKTVFYNWLNPLWDFSQLGFPCGIKEYKITPSGLRIVGYVFNQ